MQALRSRCRALMQERDVAQQECSQLHRRIARMDRDLEQMGAPLASTKPALWTDKLPSEWLKLHACNYKQIVPLCIQQWLPFCPKERA